MQNLMKELPNEKHSRLLYVLFANGVYDQEHEELLVHGTQATIAKVSGMKQSAVGRAMSDLQKEGYCTKKCRGHYVIHAKKS